MTRYVTKGGLKVDHAEFTKLHTECDTARLDYFGETEITLKMLTKCTPGPLGFQDRLKLAAQGMVENQAHLTYLGIRDLLLDAARRGYGLSN